MSSMHTQCVSRFGCDGCAAWVASVLGAWRREVGDGKQESDMATAEFGRHVTRCMRNSC